MDNPRRENAKLSLLSSTTNTSTSEVAKAERIQRKAKGSWRKTVGGGAGLAIVILVVNIGILVWTKVSFPAGEDGATTIYEGIIQLSRISSSDYADSNQGPVEQRSKS